MKNNIKKALSLLLCMTMLIVAGCSNSNMSADTQNRDEINLNNIQKTKDVHPTPETEVKTDDKPQKQNPNEDNKPDHNKQNESKKYTIDQATSDRGQLNTIAFSGLAFITGTLGADSFFPPGKVADFFGFQYMRDNDQNGLGHNTTFLTIAATNVIYILNEEQRAKLVSLAAEQETLFEDFALGRFTMMTSFRDYMEGNYPEGMKLDREMVAEFSAMQYEIDAQLSFERAQVMGEIIASFSDEQKEYLQDLDFYDSSTWPVIENGEDIIDKKSMSHTQHVAVMTYASELFSWYLGNIDADAYFCPERHGTYFGGFYMKDYHAMGNPDYFISTTVTGDSGEEFLNILNDEQRAHITNIIDEQKSNLDRIVQIRYAVSEELRKSMLGQQIDKDMVFTLVKEYGYLEGEMSYMYAKAFSEVSKTLTQEQLDKLYVLRNLDIYPEGAFLYSSSIDLPEIPDSERLFR